MPRADTMTCSVKPYARRRPLVERATRSSGVALASREIPDFDSRYDVSPTPR